MIVITLLAEFYTTRRHGPWSCITGGKKQNRKSCESRDDALRGTKNEINAGE